MAVAVIMQPRNTSTGFTQRIQDGSRLAMSLEKHSRNTRAPTPYTGQ